MWDQYCVVSGRLEEEREKGEERKCSRERRSVTNVARDERHGRGEILPTKTRTKSIPKAGCSKLIPNNQI